MTTTGDLTIELRGARVRLLPERALYIESSSTLLVADLHLGKPAAFRAAALPVRTAPPKRICID